MVSIIIPCYNADKYLKVSIDSIIAQTYTNWELLIIDDGSTDNTEAFIKTFKDERIQYFYQQHKGVSAARNLGLEKMSGDYFCFLDADDYMPPRSLENRYNKFQNREELEFVDGVINTFSKDLKTKLKTWKPSYSGNPLGELLKISDSCFFGLTWMIRKKAHIKYRFQENISHGEDLLFFLEISKHGGLYDFVDDDVLHYRKGHKSAMSDLKGLEEGYHQIYQALRVSEVASVNQASHFKRKARKIIFNSYLGNYQLISAFRSLRRKW
jgi:glycosyltransferase involved in cell wall biosynthesis